jgi:hypothetical protein
LTPKPIKAMKKMKSTRPSLPAKEVMSNELPATKSKLMPKLAPRNMAAKVKPAPKKE